MFQVNFTYQFLHKKFYIFSQFLHNEHIQSRLMKDLKLFREANSDKSEDKQMYSYERANSLNKGIRQLGISKNGHSSLDLFRQLITHIGRQSHFFTNLIRLLTKISNVSKMRKSIFFMCNLGNAMGYIRMMRSGGIHCCSNASVFLAIVNKKLQFKEFCEQSGLMNVTQNSAQNLENEIAHLHHNCTETTEYFRVSQLNSFVLIYFAMIMFLISTKKKQIKSLNQSCLWMHFHRSSEMTKIRI